MLEHWRRISCCNSLLFIFNGIMLLKTTTVSVTGIDFRNMSWKNVYIISLQFIGSYETNMHVKDHFLENLDWFWSIWMLYEHFKALAHPHEINCIREISCSRKILIWDSTLNFQQILKYCHYNSLNRCKDVYLCRCTSQDRSKYAKMTMLWYFM